MIWRIKGPLSKILDGFQNHWYVYEIMQLKIGYAVLNTIDVFGDTLNSNKLTGFLRSKQIIHTAYWCEAGRGLQLSAYD